MSLENAGAEQRLQSLRAALLDDEQRHLAELREEIEALRQSLLEQELTPEHLAPVLAKSLDLAQSSQREALAEALNTVVADSVRESVRADKDSFAESLSPMIGVAIRKAITNALKGFNQAINQAVEYSLSAEGLRWRLEAWRTGVPFSQLLMRHTLPYVLEEIFLIHNEAGLLVAHASAGGNSKIDNDAVSAMLTAIQDFVRDSFAVGDGQLEEVEIGGRMVWVINGRRASFAVVVHGTPPVALRDDIETLLQQLHIDFATELDAFSKDGKAIPPLVERLETLVAANLQGARESEQALRSQRPKKRRWGLAFMCLFLLSVGSWFGWQQWQLRQQLAEAEALLAARDDVVLLDWHWQGGELVAKGLYDPLLGDLSLADYVPMSMQEGVQWQFSPYRSALPEATVALKREQWALPATVILAFEEGVWRATGAAPIAWVHGMRALARLGLPVPDIEAVTLSDKEVSAWLAEQLPVGVDAEIVEKVLLLSGQVAATDESALVTSIQQWHANKLLAFERVDTLALKRERAMALLALRERILQQRLQFASGVVMSPEGWASMQRLAEYLQSWRLASAGQVSAKLVLLRSENTLAVRRAEKLRDLLRQQGVPSEMIMIATAEAVAETARASEAVTVAFRHEPLPVLDIKL